MTDDSTAATVLAHPSTGAHAMTMTSPAHAMAYAHICDLIRTASKERRANVQQRPATDRPAGSAALRWLRRGQLRASATPCTNC